MDSRKSSSSSTIEINGAFGKRASRSCVQSLLDGGADVAAPGCEFACCAMKAAVASAAPLNLGLGPTGGKAVCVYERLWLNPPR